MHPQTRPFFIESPGLNRPADEHDEFAQLLHDDNHQGTFSPRRN
jgi:hypothetical protein